MTPEFQAITRRLEEAEKQIAHLAALVVEQSDTDRTVTAQNFVVKDTQGIRRAELGMVVPTGKTQELPWLGLFDANESVRAQIGVDTDGPFLNLYGAKGQSVAGVREWQDGPSVDLFDASGKKRMCLKVSDTGAFAYLFSTNGEQNLRLELRSDGAATLGMQDSNGEPRLLLSVDTERGPILAFLKDDEVVWSVPVITP